MKKLLFSIHDVTPRHFERLQKIDAFLQETSLGNEYAMLVVPNFWADWPLEQHPDFCRWLRQKAHDGVEMILHGYFHKDDSQYSDAIQRLRARKMTAGEGEFLGLSEQQALKRLKDGRKLLEDILSQPVKGFIAPAWLYGDDVYSALKTERFLFSEDHWRVWSPVESKVLVNRSPVISYASRSVPRILSSLAWSRIATKLLFPSEVVRQALHPHDFDKDILVKEIGRALNSLLTHRKPMKYEALL